MKRALDMIVIEGIQTTIPLHEQILSNPDFIAGRFDTTWLIYDRLTTATKQLPSEDPRTLDQKRVDLFIDATLSGLPLDVFA